MRVLISGATGLIGTALREALLARGDEVAQARAALATAKSNLAETMEKEADLAAREREATAQLFAATLRAETLLKSASALTGVPSWKVTPSCRTKVTSRPSSEISQLLARFGTILPSASKAVSVS